MTQQIPDLIRLAHHTAHLGEVEGGVELFDPVAVGIDAPLWHTACRRGYIAKFSVDTDRLLLDELDIGPQATIDGVQVGEAELFGSPAEAGDGGAVHFKDIGLPIAFTGRLLAGYGDVEQIDLGALGAPPSWCYQHVTEVIIAEGEVSDTANRSHQAAAYRAAVQQKRVPEDPRWQDPFAWIDLADRLS